MTKVTVHDEGEASPKAAAKPANGLAYVTDSKGRKIGLKEPPFLAEFDILDVLGPEKSKNQSTMGLVSVLLYIAEIDGEEMPFPTNMVQVRRLIQKADRHGFAAVLEGIEKHFSTDEKETIEKIKNSHGTPD